MSKQELLSWSILGITSYCCLFVLQYLYGQTALKLGDLKLTSPYGHFVFKKK